MAKVPSNTGSFNARYMTFKQVAESFIKTNDFDKIITNNHTVLMGSRGCGKTTLLKMLHPDAIRDWEMFNSKSLFEEIPFYGVYIPADKQWSKQIEVFEGNFKNETRFVNSVSKGLINLNVLIALCDTFRSLIQIGVDHNLKEHEISLATELIDLWNIPKPIAPDLYSITQRFYLYVNDLNVTIQKADANKKLDEFCYWDFVDKIGIAINAFEERFKGFDFFNKKPFKWALCFDELEIAPKWLFSELINGNLRSRNQKILFKLTTIPTVSSEKETDQFSSRNLDDYEIVKMWVYDSRSQTNWRSFCENYLQKVLYNKFNKNVSPKSVFGEHNYNKALKASSPPVFAKFIKTKEDSEFDKDCIMWYVMKELAQIDKSFYEYLMRKGVNPLDPIPTKKGQIDQVHRKIKPIVLYRYYFKKIDNQKRTRKVVSFNHGKDYIYDMADGNPRAFVNLINSFLPEITLNNSGEAKMMPINRQATIINDFCVKYFYPRVAYYAESVVLYNKKKIITLENIINKIGEYFREQYIGADFRPEPYSLIRFDNKCPKEIEKLFNKGLEAGGVLIVEDEIKGVRKGTKIYRLSYSLYSYYNLPQRTYAIKDLSAILDTLLEDEMTDDIQLSLNF
ncbi:MAG: hypothetical protein LBI82_08570 [Dysgonamonadaceae bacterium]|jgi:hypothetical protein|nr:hypothetical protein [Dysgonamonadaceae bacterium]